MIIDAHSHNPLSHHAVINASAEGFIPDEDRFYSLGLHPWNLHLPNASASFSQVASLACMCPQVVAIGETGLDPFALAPIDVQMHWFERHIALADECQKPLIIHCVRRAADIIRIHRRIKPSSPWIIHGFRSNINVARALIDEGLFLSIGERFNPLAIAVIPANRILVESDESSLPIKHIIGNIASALDVAPEVVENNALANARACFAR